VNEKNNIDEKIVKIKKEITDKNKLLINLSQ
jgi:hypothetical protein